jgi:hypothetical protein
MLDAVKQEQLSKFIEEVNEFPDLKKIIIKICEIIIWLLS